MTPQELKNSILQLAIQGKLVEQRPEEGTAEELYRQIQEEKRRMVEEGKRKKEKPLPEIAEDEVPFEIPGSWKWVHLNYIAFSSLGKTLDKVKNTGNLQPYLCSINVYWNGISLEKVKKARFEETELPKYLLQKGDLLICEGGDVGRSSVWDQDVTIYYQNALHRVRFYQNINPYFYKYLIECYKGIGIIDKFSKGVTIKHLVQNSLNAMWLPLPPLAEQKRIVAKIEELLPYIDRYEQAWNRLEVLNKRFPADMKKSLLQYAIEGKLVEQRSEEGTAEELYRQIQEEKRRLVKEGKTKKEKPLPEISDDKVPFEIPGNWKWIKLGNVASVLGGKRIPAGRTLTTENTGYRYIRVSDMKNGSVLADRLLYVPQDIYPSISRYVIHKEDIYITVAGTIGRIGKIPAEIDGANLTENADRLVFSTIYQDWLIKCLEAPFIQSQIADVTTKVGQPKLAIKRIQELLFPLPPLAEQKRIVAKLEELLPLCERLK